MSDSITYFALHADGRMMPIGSQEELCDEVVGHVIERGEWSGAGVSVVRVDLPDEGGPPAPEYPRALLASFGVCAVIGAFTLARWLWLAVGLII